MIKFIMSSNIQKPKFNQQTKVFLAFLVKINIVFTTHFAFTIIQADIRV